MILNLTINRSEALQLLLLPELVGLAVYAILHGVVPHELQLDDHQVHLQLGQLSMFEI